jgi:uncharacterized DUF497 family protein
MDFIWDQAKNEWLKEHRAISFEEIAAAIRQYAYLDIVENPSRADQQCFILTVRGYTWAVPFIFDETDRMVLKTAYPSRSFHRIYGGKEG